MDEKEFEIITLEDNLDYAQIDNINYNDNTYVFLSEVDNPDNFCIRKLKTENNEKLIIGLATKEEFDIVLKLFTEKYTN